MSRIFLFVCLIFKLNILYAGYDSTEGVESVAFEDFHQGYLLAYGGGIPGQKHRGEGFMEGFRSTKPRESSSSRTHNAQIGDTISTEDGDYRVIKTETLAMPDVRFAFDSYDIASVFEKKIWSFANDLLEKPNAEVLLEGHTDWIGSSAYNMTLSRHRANAVKNKLMEFGIEEHRIQVRGYGETRPIANNTTSKGRAKNRRVEMIIIEPI